MFCGILPWTWFSSSLLESSNVLIAGGNLIRKVLFPAEVLPIVTRASPASCTSVSGCRSWRRSSSTIACRCRLTDLLWLPVIVLVQLC